MSFIHRPWAVLARAAAFAFAFTVAAAMSGCATPYLDGAVKDVAESEFKRPVPAQPVQVIVEFQTNGAPNARATEHVKPMVLDRVKTSGLFSDVQDKPNGGGTLSVRINNVALLDEAFKKGFMTGLTFGIAGNTVTDGYLCTVAYTRAGESTPIVKTSKHAIHSTVGASNPPTGGVKAGSLDEAVRIMVRQIVGNAMKDLSQDAAFH